MCCHTSGTLLYGFNKLCMSCHLSLEEVTSASSLPKADWVFLDAGRESIGSANPSSSRFCLRAEIDRCNSAKSIPPVRAGIEGIDGTVDGVETVVSVEVGFKQVVDGSER